MQNDETDIQEIVDEITSTVGINYRLDNGKLIRVKYGKLDEIFPLHPKAAARLYVELMQEGGMPKIIIVGAITSPMTFPEVTGMTLKGYYKDERGLTRQIWINNTELSRVRVTIPTTDHSFTYQDQNRLI